MVCTTEGEVDIVTEVSPADASRVEASEHATLVAIDAVQTIVGIINRDADGVPLNDVRARQALNLAIDRAALVREALYGRAVPLARLTPLFAVPWLNRRLGYRHDPGRAAELWRSAAADGQTRPLRIAAWSGMESVARRVAADLTAALGLEVEVAVVHGAAEREARRQLAEMRGPYGWDILILQQRAQAVDAPPLEQHRAFVGQSGEFRAGPVVPEFEELYAELTRQTSRMRQGLTACRIDRFVSNTALALFLCAPQALYAVNRHVAFIPYRTTFELAECHVGQQY